MNYRFVLNRMGLVMSVLGLLMALVVAAELLGLSGREGDELVGMLGLGGTSLFALLTGGGLWRLTRGDDRFFGRREAMLLVAAAWFIAALLSAAPFWVWALNHTTPESHHPFRSLVSCFFEATSGLTTTGSTVLAEVEAVPRSLLLWRATTHWIGGLGIVVLFVAVWPTLGVGGRRLFQFESSGKSGMDAQPRIRHMARLLWLVYLGLTVAQILLLRLCGLTWFDSVCETFGTMSSGGFSTKTASIAAYQSAAVEMVCVLFMVLTGVNFALYLQLFTGKARHVLKDPELRFYLLTTVLGTVVVAACLVGRPIITSDGVVVEGTTVQSLRYSLFQVVSLRTNTGFVTANFDGWGFLPHFVMFGLMFMGASAGSTGGGVKVIRCLIAGKVIGAEIERAFRPNVVRAIKIGGQLISPVLRLETLVFLLLYGGVFLGGSVLVMLFEPAGEIDYKTAATACAATLNTAGPGLGRVGAVGHFGWLSEPSQLVLSVLMVLGRLEIYAVVTLLLPSYWRSE